MKLLPILTLFMGLIFFGCQTQSDIESNKNPNQYITILGVAQDAGYPQIGCNKKCCKAYYDGKESKKLISCLGLVDRVSNKKYIIDATPDIVDQIQILKEDHLDNGKTIDGIFLTHAHIGHYTGLMHFGREAFGSKKIPVYAMPKMRLFLEQNGPWSQLVSLANIIINDLKNDSTIVLNKNLNLTPFIVPHRDEYSETIGFKINGKHKTALFISDINKWHLWEKNIVEEVKKVDYVFLDATFFKDGEISRPMSEVPHPFVQETVELFKNESIETRSKINFIHFNHTNPALLDSHKLKDSIQNLGFNFAKDGMNYAL